MFLNFFNTVQTDTNLKIKLNIKKIAEILQACNMLVKALIQLFKN